MGHEVIITGHIQGSQWRAGKRFTWTFDLNREVIGGLPTEDEWPFLVRDSFALPALYPHGIYRTQIIHFGLSLKDEPTDRDVWDLWIHKFEAVLRRMYWLRATVTLETEFEAIRTYEWFVTTGVVDRLYEDPPQPVNDWTRSVRSAR